MVVRRTILVPYESLHRACYCLPADRPLTVSSWNYWDLVRGVCQILRMLRTDDWSVVLDHIFTSPKWESEWAEKEIADLCLNFVC